MAPAAVQPTAVAGLTGKLTAAGSSALLPMMQLAATQFQQVNKDVQISVTAGGSGAAGCRTSAAGPAARRPGARRPGARCCLARLTAPETHQQHRDGGTDRWKIHAGLVPRPVASNAVAVVGRRDLDRVCRLRPGPTPGSDLDQAVGVSRCRGRAGRTAGPWRSVWLPRTRRWAAREPEPRGWPAPAAGCHPSTMTT